MRKIFILGFALTSIIVVSGCTANKVEKNQSANQSNIASQSQLNQDAQNKSEDSENLDVKIDAGQYVGQIDGNSIEIKIIGVQSEKDAFRAFKLSPEVKKRFDSYSLKKDDFIRLKYTVDNNQAKIIHEIEKYSEVSKREKNKKIEVKVEGSKEMRDADLKFSDSLGYSLYVLKNYTFSAEEPGKDIIFSNYDKDFFVRIEKLDAKTDLTEYIQSQKRGYQIMGKITDIDPSTLFIEQFKDSKFCFNVSILKPDNLNMQTSIIYVVKDFGGNLYSFTFHMPLKEAAEGITPSLWSMVSTMETN